MKVDLKKIFSWLVGISIVIAPSNLFLVLNHTAGYVNGLRIDYLIPKLYLIELVVIPILIVGGLLLTNVQKKEIRNIFINQKNRFLLFCVAVLIGVQFFSSYPIISVIAIIRIVVFISLGWLLFAHKKFLNQQIITIALISSMLIQFCFAIGQSTLQHSLTPYWLTGEPKLNSSMIGLARGSFNGEERLLAYGTTAHPNILAGIMVLFSLALISCLGHRKLLSIMLAVLPTISIIFLTQSLTALLAFLLGLTIILLQKYQPEIVKKTAKNIFLLGIVLVIFSPWLLQMTATRSISVERRGYLHQAAVQMLFSHPSIGVGLGGFTGSLETYLQNPEYVRFIQPVHNVFWLLAAETGLLGIVILVLLTKRIIKQQPAPLLLALIPMLAFDHYLLSESGMLVVVIFLVKNHAEKETQSFFA